MKLSVLLALLSGSLLPANAQDPQPAAPRDPLRVDPARDLFDFATLNYNDARKEENDAKRKDLYRGAAKVFDRFLRRFPNDGKALDAWYFLGMSYRELGETQASRKCFETAATRWDKGRFVEASALFLASDDYKAEKWRSAAQWFEIVTKTTAKDKIRHQSRYRRFLCFHKLNDKGAMLLALKAVIADKGSPYTEKARLSLARLYRESQSPREAHEQFVILAASQDRDIRAEATLQAAVTAQDLNDPKLTKKWFRQAITAAQEEEVKSKTQLALMNLHYKDQEWQDVVEVFRMGRFKLDPEASLQRLIMAAKSHEALGNKKEVALLYQQIAKASPDSTTGFEASYRVLIQRNEKKVPSFPQDAESFLKTHAAEHAKDAKIHSIRLLLAEHYFAQKKYEKALSHYRQLDLALVDRSNELGVRYHVAKTQIALEDLAGALAAIKAFIAQFPESDQALQLRIDRADLLNKAGREAEAADDYQAILKRTTDDDFKRILLLRLAAIYQEQEKWEDFRKMQERILQLPKLDPKAKAAANFWLGWNELRLKNHTAAEPFLRKARSLDPKKFTAKVGPILVKSAFKSGDLALLEKEINLVRQNSPETELPHDILQWLGATLVKQGHAKRGWPFLHETLSNQTRPAKPLIWKLYAQASLALKKHQEALIGAEAVLKTEKNAYRKAEALNLKAQAHTALKQFDEARKAISKALDLRPAGALDVRLRLFAGDIDIADGKPGDAIRHYIVVDTTIAKTPEDKKEARAKVISTLKAIGTPKALELLKDYQ